MPFSHCFQQTQARVSRWIDAVRAQWLSSPAQHPTAFPEEDMNTPPDVTQLLRQWRNGDRQALAQLTPLVYDELRRLAAHYLQRERTDHTLQATALAKFDERKSRIIELRYFGGLEMDEIAEVRGLSVATIRRDLRLVEAWLGR